MSYFNDSPEKGFVMYKSGTKQFSRIYNDAIVMYILYSVSNSSLVFKHDVGKMYLKVHPVV